LAERMVVPELLQHDATPKKLAEALLTVSGDPEKLADIETTFAAIHATLKQDTASKAAQAILPFLQ